MEEEIEILPQTNLSASNNVIDKKINNVAPSEEFVPSTGRQLLGMGIEIGGGFLSELSAPLNVVPVIGTPAYLGIKYSMGVGSSYIAQFVEGQPEWRHGRANFAGGANLVPFGSTVRKTKDGVKLFSKTMAGRATKSALKGSTISTAAITGERVIDDGRLPTLEELGFAATFGGVLGAGIDIGSVQVGEKFLPVWDKMKDGMKSTFLKVAGKSPTEIRELIAKGKLSREEFRTLRDQLVDDAYKDAGFFDGFMGNKKIDVNSLKPEQRLDYVQNRTQYLDELEDDLMDNLDDGIVDAKQFKKQSQAINDEKNALANREKELRDLQSEPSPVKSEVEQTTTEDNVAEEQTTLPLDETPEVKPTDAPKTPFKSTTGDEAIDTQLTKTEMMTPDEYLRQAWEATDGKLGGSYESWLASNKLTNADRAKYVQAMKDGDEFPLPYIDKYKGSQDGRNRALAAKEAGIEEIPVGIIEEPSVTVRLKDLQEELANTTSKMGRVRIQEKIDNLTPKDTPTPSPKERILELTEELMGRKDIVDADGNKIGLGDRVAVEKTEELTNLFTDYKNQVFKPVKEMVEGGNYDADEVVKLLDDYSEIAAAKFEVDNKDGSTLAVRREDRTADQFQKGISERKQTEVDDIVALRNMVKQDKEQPIDFDNLESLRKRIMGEVEPEVAPNLKDEGIDRQARSPEEQELLDDVDNLIDSKSGTSDDTVPTKTAVSPTKTLAKISKQIEKLKKELETKRQRFADDDADLSQDVKSKSKKPENPEIIKLKERIGFYNRAEKAVRDFDNALKEQARLSKILKIGKIKDIEAEVTKDEVLKGTGSSKSQLQKRLNKVNSNIAQMRQAMRDTVYPPKPKVKLTPRESRTASLEQQLIREREIFTGQRNPNDPSKPITSPRIRELEAKIKFYRTASKEASEVADLEEKNKLLLSMVSGQDVSKINETLGIHPKYRPDYASKTKVKSYLNVLRKQNQKLQKEARKVQLEHLQDQANRVINPELYGKSKLDAFIDKFDELSRGNLLASTLTGTAGIFSNTVAMLGRPIRDTLGGRLWRSLPIQEKRLYRQALYRLADLISYREVVTGFFAPSNIRNMYGAALNRGQNPMFPRARARYDETIKTPRFKNQRTVDRARANQQRRDKGDGLKNSLHRIKAAATVSQSIEEIVLFGQTMLGVLDVPFANAITKSRLRADALRDAIRNEAKDIDAHVKKYIDEAYEYQNGKKVWAYKDKYLDVINEYREALLMPRDLKEGDIRKTISETIVEKVDKETGSGRIFGRIIQLLFPIRTTGAIATGQIVSKVGALPINIGRLAHKGLAKVSPESRLVEGTAAGILERTKNNVKRYKKVLREGVDDKGNKLTDESRSKINEQLVVEETRLAKLSQQMEEIDRKAIGNLAMFGATWLYFWNLTDEETYTGSGAHLTRQQRKDSNFQAYKMLFDDGDTMVDYRMADPDKAVIAFQADVKSFQKLSDNNQLVEGQTLTKTMRQSAYQIITDNPFMTGYRNVGTAINPEADEDRYLKAFFSIITSRFQPPSMYRHINQFDDVYVPDHTQSKPLDMVVDKMFGNAPVNVRRYETGAPMFLPEKNIWNFLGRFMPTKKVRMRFQEVYDILESDGQRTDIVSGLSPTQTKSQIKTKEYWNNENDQTLYDAFGDFIYKYSPTKAIKVGKKSYRDLTLEEAMYEIITDPDWDDKYQNGKISNVDFEGFMYSDDFYDNLGNIQDATEVTNEGLQELQDVRLAYIRAARDEFFKQETLEQFKNRDGLTPSQEAARISNKPTE